MLLVLILLLIGGLIMGPLMGFMSTGLKVGQLHEDMMYRLYAADAGIEDGLYKIKNEELPLDPYDWDTVYTYNLPDINGKAVEVTIQQTWPLADFEDDSKGTMPHAELVVTGFVIDNETGEYQVEISYDGSQGQLFVERVGVWLPAGFGYVDGSASGITTDNPTITDWRGGKALTWDFIPKVKFEDLPPPPAPAPPPGGFEPAVEYPMKRILNFNYDPPGQPEGTYSWIRTNRNDIYLAWDIDAELCKVTSTATDATTGKQTTIESYTSKEKLVKGETFIKGDYRAIGNSLMQHQSGDYKIRETLLAESSATIQGIDPGDIPAEGVPPDRIPTDAEVEAAYLYWSAWKESPGYTGTEENITELAEEVMEAEFNGQAVTAQRVQILENQHGWSYSCFVDVTDKISDPGTGTYTVGDVEATEGVEGGGSQYEWAYAGWSLVIIYASPSERSHNLFLYDNFLYADSNTYHEFTISGFVVPEMVAGEEGGRLTCFVGEGDEHYDGDSIRINDNLLPEPPDGVNPQDNVWNGKSSGLGGEPIDGVDIDTFDISSHIDEGDTWAEVKLETDISIWNLVYIVLSFRSDIEASLTANAVGSITYSIH